MNKNSYKIGIDLAAVNDEETVYYEYHNPSYLIKPDEIKAHRQVANEMTEAWYISVEAELLTQALDDILQGVDDGE